MFVVLIFVLLALAISFKTKRVYRYYKCVNRKLHKTCNAAALSKGHIESLVVEWIFKFISGEELHDCIEKYYNEMKKRCLKSMYPKINREKKQLIKKLDLLKNTDLNIHQQNMRYG